MKDNREMAAFNTIRLFGRLPGISGKLVRRITEELDVHTLEELELAAHDGSLKKLKGFGLQRVQAVKEGLAGRSSARPSSPRKRSKRRGMRRSSARCP